MTSAGCENEREATGEPPSEFEDPVVFGEYRDLIEPPSLTCRYPAVEGGYRADPKKRQQARAGGGQGALLEVRDHSAVFAHPDHLAQNLSCHGGVEVMKKKCRDRPVKARIAKRQRRDIRGYRRT